MRNDLKNPTLCGLSDFDLSLLEQDFMTPEIITGLLKMRAALLHAMDQASSNDDMDLFDQLDGYYDEVQEVITTAIEDWPDQSLLPLSLDDYHL